MSPAVMSLIMIVAVVVFLVWNKIPQSFVMSFIPIVCALGLGYSISEINSAIQTQLASTMNSVGYMLMFGMLYLTMLSQTGMFNMVVEKLLKLFGKNINVIFIFILTTVFGAIGQLTVFPTTAYLCCFPVLLGLYRKYNINRVHAFVACQTVIAALFWLPWGLGISKNTMVIGCEPSELIEASIPFALCLVPIIILQWFYFAYRNKKERALIPVQEQNIEKEEKENPFARPNRFWINLIQFIITIILMLASDIPLYLLLMFDCMLTVIINYPKDYQQLWKRVGVSYFNMLQFIVAISIYLAIFNISSDGRESMVSALAGLLLSYLPEFLVRYAYIILLFLAPIFFQFVPRQALTAMYPMFIAIGANFGLTGAQVIAPYTIFLPLCTGATVLSTSTIAAAGILEIDVQKIVKEGLPILFITNTLAILIAIVTGLIPLW